MKKISSMMLIVIIFISVAVPVYAEEVLVEIPEFDVSVNGHIIDTQHSQYPVLRYNGITYFPMTSDYLNGIGLKLTFSNESGLTIKSGAISGTFTENFLGASNKLGAKTSAQIASFRISVNDKIIDNNTEEYPILSYKNVTYFPMTWRFAVTEFGWQTKWDDNTGFGIIVGNETVNTANYTDKTSDISKDVTNSSKLSSVQIGELADAVVKIYIYSANDIIGTGSGFFCNDSGMLITNYHVIEGADKVTIQMNDESLYDGYIKVVGYDKELDIAILETGIANNKYLNMGNSDLVKQGEIIYTLGSPKGLLNTLAEGIISSVRDDIQITAPISPGSSGGVLLDEFGNAIGVTTYGVLTGENLGFAVPMNKVMNVKTDKLLSLNEVEFDNLNYEEIVFDNGDTYYGEIQNGDLHGYGVYTWVDGDEYIGNYINGKRHGYGEYNWPDGGKYSGNWVEDNLNGYGKRTYSNGDVYEGVFKDDLYHGTGRLVFDNGYYYEGCFYEGYYDGYGAEYFTDGVTYSGMFYKGEYYGNGLITFTDGSTISGSFKENKHYSDYYDMVDSPAVAYTSLVDAPYYTGYGVKFETLNGYICEQISGEVLYIDLYDPKVVIYRSGDKFLLMIENVTDIVEVKIYE